MKIKALLSALSRFSVVFVMVLAAIFCLVLFLIARKLSYSTHTMGWAVTEAENIAEDLVSQSNEQIIPTPTKGSLQEDGQWMITYDAEWNETEQGMVYYALIELKENGEDTWRGNISMYMKNGVLLYELPVSGQK